MSTLCSSNVLISASISWQWRATGCRDPTSMRFTKGRKSQKFVMNLYFQPLSDGPSVPYRSSWSSLLSSSSSSPFPPSSSSCPSLPLSLTFLAPLSSSSWSSLPSYGLSTQQIQELFVAGFGSSLVFGTFVGSLADQFGRRFNCIIYGLTYAVGCMTKHFPNYYVLMCGRFLAGLSTSILYRYLPYPVGVTHFVFEK